MIVIIKFVDQDNIEFIFIYMYIYIVKYCEKNIVLVLVPRLDSDK